MTSLARFTSFLLIAFYFPAPGFSQGNKNVVWQFKSDYSVNGEALLTFTANVAPGWHLYSQFIEEDGPMPTRFTFEQTDEFMLAGGVEEKGKPVKFRDETYEMEITWYSDTASFLQKIKLKQSSAIVKGRVEYMICNNYSCVPDKLEFSIDVRPLR